MTPSFKERLREILEKNQEWRYINGKTVLQELTLDEALSEILKLVKEAVAKEYSIPSEFNAGWNACRQQFLKNIGEDER